MPIRIRISELMKDKGFQSAYEFANAAKGRISARTAYRLVEADGAVKNFSAATLEGLAEVFEVPVGQLFDRSRPSRTR
jgi:hypothetical protein